MKKISYKIIIVIALLFIALIPNFSNAAKVYVKKVSKIWVSSTTSSEVKVKWKKVKKAKGYKVYVYNYSRNKYELYATTSKTNIKVKNLKSAKKYKFRVREYKIIDGRKYYGNYSDVIKLTTKTKTPTISKLKAGKKKATVKYKKVSGAYGYQIQYSTNKKFKKGNKSSNTTKLSKTVKKLKSKKKYYVRIRTYRTVNGKKIYSNWSKVKNIKVK